MYFGKRFDLLSDDQITNYLCHLQERKVSNSTIKFIIYGYRFLFKVMKSKDRNIEYRAKPVKVGLPVVLNQKEIKLVLAPNNCTNLKHRIILCLLYSSGLRISELLKLKIQDVDFDAARIFIHKSKNGISRYVVLSKLVAKGLKQYLSTYNPKNYLINSYTIGKPYSRSSVAKIVHKAVKNAGVTKHITIHSLRHSFAVHFLEQGGNILQLKDQLGHKRLQSTLIYLRITPPRYKEVQSPLDVLYDIV